MGLVDLQSTHSNGDAAARLKPRDVQSSPKPARGRPGEQNRDDVSSFEKVCRSTKIALIGHLRASFCLETVKGSEKTSSHNTNMGLKRIFSLLIVFCWFSVTTGKGKFVAEVLLGSLPKIVSE